MSKTPKRKLHPPLSLLDKSIYITGLLLFVLICMLIAFCFEDITSYIAFSDHRVVASVERASFLFVLPFIGYFLISGMVFFILSLQEKIPIYGNKKVRYGEHPWNKDLFPLFDKRRKYIYISPSKRKYKRKWISLWCVGLIITILFIPFSLFGRECLMKDNSIVTYSMFNTVKDNIYTSQYTELQIKTVYVSGRYTADYWQYQITLKTVDNKKFVFSNRDFDWRQDNAKDRALDTMLEIKVLFPSSAITVSGEEDLEKVIKDHGLNDSQTQKLYRLFDH